MFLPMSCTSPFTVAMSTRPCGCLPPDLRFSSSMNGNRYATDFFITRALFTTCGKNILPEPNKSPTTFMPAINGPSITSSGLTYFWRASSVSWSMWSTIPFTSACESRSSTVPLRHSSSTTSALPFCFTESANLTSTSSTNSSRSLGISSYTSSIPAFTMPMSIPAWIAWYKNAECIASRTTLLPRKENEMLLTPPLTRQRGRVALMRRVASMKLSA